MCAVMKRILLWFGLVLFVVLIVTIGTQYQSSTLTATPLIKTTLPLIDKQESARLSAQLTKKIFSKYPEAAVPLDCFAQDKWGFMDTFGHLVVPVCFDDVSPFSDGVAGARVQKKKGDQYYGFINREGIFVIPPTLTYQQFQQSQVVLGFSESRLPLRRESKGKIGYIDKTGTFVINPQFDEARPFSEGLAGVCWYQEPVTKSPERRCGYIDSQGNLVIKPRFAYVRSFQNGLAVVQTPENKLGHEARLGVIDREGNYLVEPNLDFVNLKDRYAVANPELKERDSTPFYSGLLRVRVPDSEFSLHGSDDGIPDDIFGPGKWGYVRKTGGYVIKPRFRSATNFSEERAVVEIDKNDAGYSPAWRGKTVLIDTTGNIINTRGQNPEPILSWTTTPPFKEGITLAQASNKRYGFINRDGRWAIRPVFSEIRNFSEGFAAAKDAENHKWGYINQQGHWAIQPQFGDAEQFSHGLAAVQNANGKWGYINQKGELVISPQFNRAEPFEANGLTSVQIDQKYGLINRAGNYALEPRYEFISRFTDDIAGIRLSKEDPNSFVTKSGRVLPYTQPIGPVDITEGLVAVSGQSPENFEP